MNADNCVQCLLPLANTPLIEYTLEFLANAGVEDIFIYCGAHTEQVEQYIKYVLRPSERMLGASVLIGS